MDVMPIINKPEDWWKALEENKNEIADIVALWGQMKRDSFLTLVEKKDMEELDRVMNLAWWKAPDRKGLHNIPGWLVMCDLLSEVYILRETKNG